MPFSIINYEPLLRPYRMKQTSSLVGSADGFYKKCCLKNMLPVGMLHTELYPITPRLHVMQDWGGGVALRKCQQCELFETLWPIWKL